MPDNITPIPRASEDVQDQTRAGLVARFAQDLMETMARLVKQSSVQGDDYTLALFLGGALAAWTVSSFARRAQSGLIQSEDMRRLARAMGSAQKSIDGALTTLIVVNTDAPDSVNQSEAWPFLDELVRMGDGFGG